MTFHEWCDISVAKMDAVISRTKALSASPGQPTGHAAPGQGAQLDPHAVAHALAEYMKNDTPTSQAIAIRAGNLADKYPQRGY